MRTTLAIAFLILVGGCASAPEPAPPPPGPSTFEFTVNANVDVPAPIALQTGLPSSVKATLKANAHSEVIAATPLRSHHEGHLSLVITDGSGKQSLANVDITVKGDADGSPNQGLGHVISGFFDSASIMARPLPVPSSSAAK